MAAMAHERLTAVKKVKTSELKELEDRLKPGPQLLGFGKNKDLKIRPAESVLNDPAYFYWAYHSGALGQYDPWLEHQAWELIRKAAHLRPPRPRPDAWEFAIQFDRHNRFVDFEIIKKNKKLKARKGLLRVKHLDISLVSRMDKKACAKMVERIHEEFFPDRDLTHWDYQEFFEKDRNFDLDCRETHCPKISRRVTNRVCPRFDGSNEDEE